MLTLLVVYAVAIVGLGLWIGRRVRGAGDFFVAGRELGPGLLFTTMLAANIGAGSTVGAAGRGYADGIAAWWWVGSAGIGTLLLAWIFGPRIWRVAQRHELRTVGDYLELRFGRPVRFTVAVLLWIGTLAILAGQLIALAWVLQVVAGVPKLWGCLIGGLVMTIYFAAGGLLSSAWVNLLQLVILLAGFVLALPLVLRQVGGYGELLALAPATVPTWGSFWQSGAMGWLLMFLLVPAFIVSPGLLQKVYGARDERTVRRGVAACGCALLLFAAIPPLLGMAARAWAPELANPELALPTVLMEALPLWLGALGLAAVVSAEISSADAILFMLSTSLSKDLYKEWLRPDASEARVLRVARLGAVLGGAAGVGLAVLLESVISALVIFYSLLSVSLFVPIVAGLLTTRGRAPQALLAIAGGVVGYLLARFYGWSGSWWNANSVGLGLSAVLFALATLRPGTGRPERGGEGSGTDVAEGG